MKRSRLSEIKERGEGHWAEESTTTEVRLSEAFVLAIVKDYLEKEWGDNFKDYDDGCFDDVSEGVVFKKVEKHELVISD